MAGERCRGIDADQQCFFFVPRQEREGRGGRPNRLTTSGYWKATGSPGCVYSSTNNRVIGMKSTMVFYRGRAPTGIKTEWKMNEYKAVQGEASLSTSTSTTITCKVRSIFNLHAIIIALLLNLINFTYKTS